MKWNLLRWSFITAGILCVAILAVTIFCGRPSSLLRVAVVGYFDSDNMIWSEAVKGTPYQIQTFPIKAMTSKRLRDSDILLLRTIGWKPTEEERRIVQDFARNKTVICYPYGNDLSRPFCNLPKSTAALGEKYLSNPCVANARAFLKLLAHDLQGESVTVPPPTELPRLGYFYRGDQVSPTFEEFLKRDDLPTMPDNAPRIVLFGPFLNPLKLADRKPIDELITKLEKKGWRVFPVLGARTDPQLPELLKACRPDLAVEFPLGRTFSGDAGPDFFSRLDIPVLSAISLSVTEEEWRDEPIGMTGSYANLAVALPELDGVIEPTVVSVMAPNEEGKILRAPLSERMDRLVDRCDRWFKLRTLENHDKRIAFFYYKGPGQAALTAQSLDVLPSLYNTLLRLRAEGYDLGSDFPETFDAFQERIETKGRTIGQWALGALEEFIKTGQPEIVSEETYRAWFEKFLPDANRKEVIKIWGNPPGHHFTAKKEEKSFLLVSRVVFGKIVLLPQPTTDIVSDDREGTDFNSVHGTHKAPPHFYLGAYFWVREQFKADAVVHFGTHGSLEFTRGKSAVLSERCWPDILIGDLPNLYLYSVNNVGEALLAKRRIRAVLVSHLTPPFTPSGLYGAWTELIAKLDELKQTEAMTVRNELLASINELIKKNSLPLPESISLPLTDDATAIEKTCYALERLQNESVTEGLHVIGAPWTDEQTTQTAEAISGGTRGAGETREAGEIDKISVNRQRLAASFALEPERLVAGLSGRFISPSSGGDPIVNPDSIPTGRNMAGLNMERTPNVETYRVASRLIEELVERFRSKNNGAFPRRVAVTLWGGEYIRTNGLGVAQIFSLLGVRPIFDSKGSIRDVEVIPSEELGRPRIDVVVQTSGQFRDAAGSRIELIDKAVRRVAALGEEPFDNYVRQNVHKTAQTLRKSGFTKEEAAELSTARIFGATYALHYGTGIMSSVERSDRWETKGEIVDRYLLNMGGVYRNGKIWGVPIAGLLESNLIGTDLLLQTRSSNTWGPVKLDHLYEFNTLSLAIREKTDRDPETIITDARRGKDAAQNTTLHDAVREELITTLWNPKWIGALQKKGKSGAAVFPEMTRNLFGWSVVGRSDIVDEKIWDETYRVLIDDCHGLDLQDYFREKNPFALQDVTAIMLESIRKGFWSPPPEIQKNLAEIHARSVVQSGAGCSYETCGNPKLHSFLKTFLSKENLDAYQNEMVRTLNSNASRTLIEGMTLKEAPKEEGNADEIKSSEEETTPQPVPQDEKWIRLLILTTLFLVILTGCLHNGEKCP